MTRRDDTIETLRGLAVILMVAGHVIGSTQKVEMEVADDSWWRFFYDALAPYRMPLFTTISGFVYAMKPVAWGNVGRFVRVKVRRLVAPLLFTSTLVFLMSHAMGRGTAFRLVDFWMIYIYPFDLFWFLQAMILVLAYVSLLELAGCLRHGWAWVTCTVLASLAYVVLPRATVFSFHSSLYLLPFFLLGVGLRRFDAGFASREIRVWAWGGFLISLLLVQEQWWLGWSPSVFVQRVVTLGAGFSGCVLLFRSRWRVRGLARLGGFAYSIYLLHILFTSGSRLFLLRTFGAVPDWVVFPVGVVVGVVGPIAIDRALGDVPWARVLFLGDRGAPRPEAGAMLLPERPVNS